MYQNVTLAPPPLIERIATFLVVFIPFLGIIYAIISTWNSGVGYLELSLLVSFSLFTGFGITMGFHRLLTHKSFETYRPIRWFLAICGSMAIEGPVFVWVHRHGQHHTHSDAKGDPHSPNLHGDGLIGLFKGLLHAHVGWLFNAPPTQGDAYIKSLKEDRGLVIINKMFPLWVFLSFFMPGFIGFWAGGNLETAWKGFLWGGLVRIFIVHHTTWSINSFCHIWGMRPFKTKDRSRNSFIWGILGLGEGWHNNHHWRLRSARHGLRWWEIDFTWYLICLMEHIGLAWNVNVPEKSEIEEEITI